MNYHVIVDELDAFEHRTPRTSSKGTTPCCSLCAQSSWSLEDFEDVPLGKAPLSSNGHSIYRPKVKLGKKSFFFHITARMDKILKVIKVFSTRDSMNTSPINDWDAYGLAGIHRAKLQRLKDSRRRFFNIL